VTDVADEIARLSSREIEDALRANNAPAIVRTALALVTRRSSARLGRLLARFDANIQSIGVARAAAGILRELGATLELEGSCPRDGAALIVTNHPGAYDALATIAAIGRDDVALVAADRAFLRAMPRLRDHLVFVAEGSVRERSLGVRRALDWLATGRVLVQFGAGSIEPDAAFAERGDRVISAWANGTGMLAARATKAGAAVIPCFVSGVHSPRAKRLFFVKWAERRGITTIAPLVQATLPGFRDVVVRVRIGTPIDPALLRSAQDDESRTSIVRSATVTLAGR
jgi:hypothetical protein